jgi:predicted TIM-barrel fold metal-dependent hydrolase
LRDQGFIGYKIWYGPWYRTLEVGEQGYRYVDDPAHEPMFAKMEELGIMAASLHIADPNGPFGNRTPWCADPVEYWKEISALHNVLRRHPDLKLVAAHGSWLVCQDAQIDYLRFLLSTYPNFHVDLAATFQYFNMVNTENLRDFMIEYSDRILFGTDIGRFHTSKETKERAEAYMRCFRILETDELVEGSFFGREPIQGLNLPQEVLEKIYYKNALRLYPRVSENKHL